MMKKAKTEYTTAPGKLSNSQQIVSRLNAQQYKYYGLSPSYWCARDDFERVYFGRHFLTVLPDGTIHNKKHGGAYAQTIGDDCMDEVSLILGTVATAI